jgi:YVTN family beta-propeller protein
VERRTAGSILTAEVQLGDRVTDIVTNPHNSVAYAALPDSIAIIGSRHQVSSVIRAGGHPRTLSIDADGSRLFVANYGGSVSVIDVSDHRIGVIRGACCVQQVDTADGALIYAAGNSALGGRISVLGESGEIAGAVGGFDGYNITGLAADSEGLVGPEDPAGTGDPAGRTLYVGLSRRSAHHQYDAGALAIVDTVTGAVLDRIDLLGPPDTVTIGPGASKLYMKHYDLRCVSAIDLDSLVVTRIPLGDNPIEVMLTPDGSQAYVTNRTSMSVIDTLANEAAPIAVGDLPRRLQISPDGKRAYVSNFGDGSVSIIDTVTQSPTDTIDVGGHPEALALSPDGDHLYIGDYWSGTVTVLPVQP